MLGRAPRNGLIPVLTLRHVQSRECNGMRLQKVSRKTILRSCDSYERNKEAPCNSLPSYNDRPLNRKESGPLGNSFHPFTGPYHTLLWFFRS